MSGVSSAQGRADYASTRERALGAWVKSVEDGSPAWEAGLEAGMRVDAVNGQPMEDIITWRWEADGSEAELVVFDPADGEQYACVLEREPGQDWGVEFTDVLFDGIRTCVNACQFCFMSMLPKDARASLMLRDDDYRLSFLQGNFVTLTNVSDADVERIIRCRMEPMNVSIHAVSPQVRIPLIGRRAMRGMEVLQALCDADIEIHGQIVLCAGINDGEELERTLRWVEERPQITSLAIVPLGYTKYSKRFSSSFSEDEQASRNVIALLAPYQERARRELGITRFQLSDEFYLDANLAVPPASTYDGYPQFHDGIGMLRCFLDEIDEVRASRGEDLDRAADMLREAGRRVLLVCGEAALGVFTVLCERWDAPVEPFAIANHYFGGDVNVTGLIVGEDLLAQLPSDLSDTLVVLPEVMFNFDRVTLDGMGWDHVAHQIANRGGRAVLSIPAPGNLLDAMLTASVLGGLSPQHGTV
ncbi:MAG: DUF512 domain-containing protein [Coriobacteriales bacterium]|nr:DUF512 domain-containing protein [Coriobacteriales bacterium]